MAKETRTVNLRLPVEQVEYLTKDGTSINQAVVVAISKVQWMEKYADRDIANVFSPADWKYMADSLNGTLVEGDFRYSAAALCASVVDSATYDGLHEKWGVDVKQLTNKIASLSSSAIEAIYRRVETYWNKPTDLDQWAQY